MIARLLLQDPEVIVFDEAASALDYQNESEILDLLLRNAGDFFRFTFYVSLGFRRVPVSLGTVKDAGVKLRSNLVDNREGK